MNNFSGRLPATSCSPSPATVSLCPWPCTGLSSNVVSWMRKLNPWKKSTFILINVFLICFLSICLFYLFWVCFVCCCWLFLFFLEDQVCHPASCPARTIQQERYKRNELLLRFRNGTGQLKHPPAQRVPDEWL